jgi:hypothetical protein
MATLAVQQVLVAGIVPTYAAVGGGGDKVPTGGGVFLHVKNGDGSPTTVTIDDPTTRDPGAATAFNPDAAITIAAGAEKMIGPIGDRFADPSDANLADITYSNATAITIAALRV